MLKTLRLLMPYLDTQIVWLKKQKGVACYTVHKHQPGQTITNPWIYLRNKTTVTVNHSLLKAWSIRRNLFNEALTDGLGLKAHPEPTQRQIGPTLTIYTTVTTPTGSRWRQAEENKDTETTTMKFIL